MWHAQDIEVMFLAIIRIAFICQHVQISCLIPDINPYLGLVNQ